MMKKYIWSIVASISLFVACQNSTKMETAQDTVTLDTNEVPVAAQSCYAYIKNRDTASLTFMTSGNITTGELNYKLFEKDANKGMIKGEMRGDTLIADYTFNSEGKESIREVVFLKKGDQLLEGYGDVMEKDGKMVFKDRSKLTFGSMEFTKVACK